MAENNDDNDPFEEDIIFDQTDLLHQDSRAYHQLNMSQRPNIIPRFFIFIRTVSLCLAFLGLGMCASLSQGPIIQMETHNGIPKSQALHIFTTYCLGMLIGGILGSWLFEKYNRQFLIFKCLLSIGVFISILPFAVASSFMWTLITLAALGSGLSFMFTGGNVLCLDMWGKNGPGYLVSVHFSFALGAFLASIIIHPLLNISNIPILTNSSNLSESLQRNSFKIGHSNMSLVPISFNADKFGQLYDQDTSKVSEHMMASKFSNLELKKHFTLAPFVTESPSTQINDMGVLSAPNVSTFEPKGSISSGLEMKRASPSVGHMPTSDLHRDIITGSDKNESVTSNASSIKFLDLSRSYEYYGITGMHVAYIIIGLFMMLNAAISLIFLCINPREPRSKQIDSNYTIMNSQFVTLFTVSFAIYMFTTEAVQGSVHHFLAASSLMSESNDGQATFWGLICLTRFLSIFVTGCLHIRPQKILLGCNFVMLLGTVLVCVGTFDQHEFLYGGIVFIAIGLAPVLPSCFLWMANIMRVTHKMCAFMIIVSSIGNSVTHTSLTLVLSDSHLYSYIMLTFSICSILFLFLSLYLAHKLKSSMEHCFRNCSMTQQFDDEEGLSMLVSEEVDGNRQLQHRMAQTEESSQSLLID